MCVYVYVHVDVNICVQNKVHVGERGDVQYHMYIYTYALFTCVCVKAKNIHMTVHTYICDPIWQNQPYCARTRSEI